MITAVALLSLQLAQTKLLPTQVEALPIPSYEEQWCPGPALTVVNSKTLLVGQRWSNQTPCLVHFNLTPPTNVDPLHVESLVEPFNIQISPTFTGDDMVYLYHLAPGFTPVTPAKLGVRVSNAGSVTCGACAAGVEVDNRRPRMMPANSVPIGVALIKGGVFLPKTTELITRHQIYLANGEMSIREEQGGLLFSVSPVTAAAANIALQSATLAANKLANEARMTKAAPEIEQRISALETYFMEIVGKIPKGSKELREMQERNDISFSMSANMLTQQTENLVMQMQTALNQAESLATAPNEVPVPKGPKEACEPRKWARDNKYMYRCVGRAWVRMKIDDNWK